MGMFSLLNFILGSPLIEFGCRECTVTDYCPSTSSNCSCWYEKEYVEDIYCNCCCSNAPYPTYSPEWINNEWYIGDILLPKVVDDGISGEVIEFRKAICGNYSNTEFFNNFDAYAVVGKACSYCDFSYYKPVKVTLENQDTNGYMVSVKVPVTVMNGKNLIRIDFIEKIGCEKIRTCPYVYTKDKVFVPFPY